MYALPHSVSPTTPNIHGLCSCMNCQHSKPFPLCHSLRMQHLLKPHYFLLLNNVLTLYCNLTTQDQQHPYLLRPYPVTLLIGISKTSWPVQYTKLGTTTHSCLLSTKNTWHICIFISQKHAWSKIPLRQGSEHFHQLHFDIMRNPFCFGLTTATNHSAYLFIVTTPGEMTCWIGNQTESNASIITALKSWLTKTAWPNKIRLFPPHQQQIRYHISKIHSSMQWPWK
jgi:hypothetical protein